MSTADPDEDELELIRRSGVALRTGKLCLSAGHGSYRVEAAMARVAHAGSLGYLVLIRCWSWPA